MKLFSAFQKTLEKKTGADFPKVFIVGSGRSGTSWVRRLFLDHPSASGPAAESHLFLLAGPFIQEEKKFDRDWAAVLSRYDALPAGTCLKMLMPRRDLLALVDALRAQKISQKEKGRGLARGILEYLYKTCGGSPGKVFIEKTPAHLFYVRDILEMDSQAKFICVIRDGRDVCVSLQKARERGFLWCPKERRDQMLLWKKASEYYLELLKDPAVQARMTAVRYEVLKASPETEIPRMFEFAGLSAPKALVDKLIREYAVERLIGKEPRVYKGTAGVWREEFTPEDERLFYELCGDVFEKMGYSK